MSSSVSNNRPITETVWYTAKSKNSTKTSRTAIDVTLLPGMVLCLDCDRHDGDGKFDNYTRPATAILNAPKVLVLEVPSAVNDTVASATRRGGPIKVAHILNEMNGLGLYVNGTTDILVGGDLLGVTDGQFYLVKKSSLDGTCCAVAQEGFATDAAGYITEASFKSVT